MQFIQIQRARMALFEFDKRKGVLRYGRVIASFTSRSRLCTPSLKPTSNHLQSPTPPAITTYGFLPTRLIPPIPLHQTRRIPTQPQQHRLCPHKPNRSPYSTISPLPLHRQSRLDMRDPKHQQRAHHHRQHLSIAAIQLRDGEEHEGERDVLGKVGM